MDDLSTYSTEALLDAIVRLTHMTNGDGADRYRAQRDLARAEILKRCSK